MKTVLFAFLGEVLDYFMVFLLEFFDLEAAIDFFGKRLSSQPKKLGPIVIQFFLQSYYLMALFHHFNHQFLLPFLFPFFLTAHLRLFKSDLPVLGDEIVIDSQNRFVERQELSEVLEGLEVGGGLAGFLL